MLLNSSFPLARSSGFVAFDGGGAAETDVRDTVESAAVVSTPRLEPELLRPAKPAQDAQGWHESRIWQPLTSALVRRVEAVVVVAICGYFALGLIGAAGWF
jgi:hypothetical protein